MTVRLPALLLLFALPLAAQGQGARSGPPPDLAGVPLDLRCTAVLPIDHPALRRYPGQDAVDLARADAQDDPAVWVSEALCSHLALVLAEAGAHPAPSDVKLPARAVLTASLQRMWIEGSRIVEQRIGSTIMPVSIPHWAVATSWELTFAVEYADARKAEIEGLMRFEMGGSAEQDDYSPLRLDALLRAASLDSFAGLPRLLADEGQLGDLLFAMVDAPETAPAELGLTGAAQSGFWQLLSTRSAQRHDALAFYLATPVIPLARRVELARWFLLNDPDVGLRRDALAWLVSVDRGAPKGDSGDESFSPEMMELLRWLVLAERSSRVRAEAVKVLASRPGPDTRSLLVAASIDEDPRVADRAVSGLRKEAPPTAAELETPFAIPTSPKLPAWTRRLDGRVSPEEPSPRTLASLALALPGPAADTWLARWAARGKVTSEDSGWVVPLWGDLAREGSLRVRKEVLQRLAGETGRDGVPELIEERIRQEKEPAVRLLAVQALTDPRRVGVGALLIKLSGESDVALRQAAVEAMTEVPGGDVQRRLELIASSDPDGKVRRAARKALKARGKKLWQEQNG